MKKWRVSSEAESLHSTATVWDNHGCMPLRCDGRFLPQLERYRNSGVNVVTINVGFGEQKLADHIRVLGYFRRWILERPDEYVLAASVNDIGRAELEGKLAVAFDIEGAAAIEDQISMIGVYYKLGVRWMLIAYNRNNLVGGGCHDKDRGLTSFGREVIDEMERVGMVVCCSHTGMRTAMEVMDYSRNPIIFSHSNPRALKEHDRNITDEAMKACAATDGVVGINGIGIFLGENDARTKTIVRHIDYAVQLIGPRHVGLGLDYVFDREELKEFLEKQRSTFPEGQGYEADMQMVEPEQMPEITEELLLLGYGEDDVRDILGRNFLRIATQVWK